MRLYAVLVVFIISLSLSCSKKSGDSVPPVPLAPELEVTDFNPKLGKEGDTISITGTSFGSKIEDVLVFFNRDNPLSTIPFKVTPTQILVIVPKTAKNGVIGVDVKGVGSTYSRSQFSFLPPAAYFSFAPDSARPGELIKISGSFNGSNLNSVKVKFFGSSEWLSPTEVETLTGGYTSVLVRVPDDAKTGKFELSSEKEAPGKSQRDFMVIPAMPPIKAGAWTRRSDFGGTSATSASGKDGAVAFTINNKAYIVCGTTGAPFDGFGTSDVWEYDPQYNSWRQKASFPGGNRTYGAGFSIGNKGYFGTGLDKDVKTTKDFWEYDPALNKWTKKADFPGVARGYAVGYSLNNLGYIGTGNDLSANLKDFYEFNPATDTWTASTEIPVVRREAYSFVSGGKAYVGGGRSTGNLKDLYMYDPATKLWTAKAGIPNYEYTSLNAGFSIKDKGYAGLGYDVRRSPVAYGCQEVYEYSVTSNTWKALPVFGGSHRSSTVGFAIGDVGYLGLGVAIARTHTYRDFWAFAP